MTKHYFAADGNFGGADGLLTVDTENWTEEDWYEITEEATDSDRLEVAEKINAKYIEERIV
jgi:hypothetical protein